MRAKLKSPAVIALAVCLTQSEWAQTAPNPAPPQPPPVSAPSDQATPDLGPTPSFDLHFEAGDPIPGITASPVLMANIPCGADGSVLLDMLVPTEIPPLFFEHAIYLIRDGKSVSISLKSVPGISDVRLVHNLFAANSGVSALLYARKQPMDKPSPADYKDFIAKFDHSGGYKELVELPFSGPVFRFAMLPSGDIVIIGFDAAGSVPRLLLLDSSGGIKGPIQMPGTLQDSVEGALGGESAGTRSRTEENRELASKAMGLVQFAAYRDSVLLWLPGKNLVLEIGDGGARREVEVEPPKGYALEAFLPSNTRWIVQFKRQGLPDSEVDRRPETQNVLLYEVNPSDGSLRRKLIEDPNPPFSSAACEHDGRLLSFRTDEKQHLIPLAADLGR
jgi:hypothetical protein